MAIRICKRFRGRKPVIDVATTPKGREAFSAYIGHLERLLRLQEA